MRFVDISHWNGNIDFNALKKDVDGVIMKLSQGSTVFDSMFDTYYQKATAAGLRVGAYVFMSANTQRTAESEAVFAMKCLNGRPLPLGLWLDVEDDKIRKVSNFDDNCVTELTIWKNHGYNVGIYANLNWYNNYLTDRLRRYPIWIARYSPNDGSYNPSSKPDIDPYMWQYTSKGKVAGIKGDVDLDEVYKTFETVSFPVQVLTNLNVREGAGTEYPVVDTIIVKYKIYDTKKSSDGGTWGRTDIGWINISSKYVQRL